MYRRVLVANVAITIGGVETEHLGIFRGNVLLIDEFEREKQGY